MCMVVAGLAGSLFGVGGLVMGGCGVWLLGIGWGLAGLGAAGLACVRSGASDWADVSASVVHVAPASPTLRGPYVLAEIDEVINGLRNFGPRTVPNINIWLRSRGGDPSGHTLVGTYLDGTPCR